MRDILFLYFSTFVPLNFIHFHHLIAKMTVLIFFFFFRGIIQSDIGGSSHFRNRSLSKHGIRIPLSAEFLFA